MTKRCKHDWGLEKDIGDRTYLLGYRCSKCGTEVSNSQRKELEKTEKLLDRIDELTRGLHEAQTCYRSSPETIATLMEYDAVRPFLDEISKIRTYLLPDGCAVFERGWDARSAAKLIYVHNNKPTSAGGQMTEPERDYSKEPFSHHEVLDRTFLLQHTFENFICEHPFVTTNPELKAAADRINELMAEFYQSVGRIEV